MPLGGIKKDLYMLSSGWDIAAPAAFSIIYTNLRSPTRVSGSAAYIFSTAAWMNMFDGA